MIRKQNSIIKHCCGTEGAIPAVLGKNQIRKNKQTWGQTLDLVFRRRECNVTLFAPGATSSYQLTCQHVSLYSRKCLTASYTYFQIVYEPT